MALGTTYPFGMREIMLEPISNAGVVGAGVMLPNSRKMTWTEAESFVELRGGDRTITSRGQGAVCNFELEGGGYSLEAYAVIAGGTVVTAGVTPNQTKTYSKNVDDVRPFFKATGRSLADEGGDFKVVIYRCRATGDIPGELSDGNYLLQTVSGQGFPSQEVGAEGALYDLIQSESETPLAP